MLMGTDFAIFCSFYEQANETPTNQLFFSLKNEEAGFKFTEYKRLLCKLGMGQLLIMSVFCKTEKWFCLERIFFFAPLT